MERSEALSPECSERGVQKPRSQTMGNPDQGTSCAGLTVILVDVLHLLLGLALIGCATYLVIEGNSLGATLLTPASAYIAYGVGAGLLIVAVLGFVISQRGASTMLRCVYFLLALGCLGAVIAGTVLLANYRNQVSLAGVAGASAAATGFAETVNNVGLSFYTEACTGWVL